MVSLTLLPLVLVACAFDVVRIDQIPVILVSAQPIKAPLVLDEDLGVNLATGYSRTLNAGATWTNVGHIPNGDVYKTDDQILTIEGSNIYEAYLVVKDGALIGFYLPVERTFSPLRATLTLPIRAD